MSDQELRNTGSPQDGQEVSASEKPEDDGSGRQEELKCVACGHPIEQDDLVCPNCGISLVAG
jgi:rubrerythrin